MSHQKKFIQEGEEEGEEEDEADDVFYTPPERRRLFTWDDISGLSALDSSPDRSRPRSPTMLGPRERVGSPVQHRYPVPSSPRYDDASTSDTSQQQLEPSVRPKVRPGPTSTLSKPPRLFIPKHPETPTPEIVRRYRDPITGKPDFQSMRRSAEFTPFGTSEEKGVELANRSRRQLQDFQEWPYFGKGRQMKLLHSKGFGYDMESSRYKDRSSGSSNGSDVSNTERRHLIPGRERDERELLDPRFSRPLDMMGERARSQVMPVGGLGFGRLDPNYRSKYHEVDELRIPDVEDDPAQWNPKEQAFALRLRSLSKDDINTYRNFRSEADPQFQQFARRRMLPAPTDANLIDYNKSYLGQMKRHTISSGSHWQRRAGAGSRASLPSSLDETTVPLTPLNEGQRVPTGGGASTFLRRRDELVKEQQDERTRSLLYPLLYGKGKEKKKKKKCFIQ